MANITIRVFGKISQSVFFILSFLLFLTACGNNDTAQTPKKVEVDSSPSEIPIATNTSIPFTNTPISTVTSRPTLTPSLTPLATLPSNEALEVILGLLNEKSDCRLPCWWGIVPGETRADVAYNYMSSLSPKILGDPTGRSFYVDIRLPESIHTSGFISIMFRIQDDVISSITVGGLENTQYSFQQILSDYGQPDEVWVDPGIDAHDQSASVQFILLYNTQGILVIENIEGEFVGNEIIVCPHLAITPALGLLPAGREFTLRDAVLGTEFSNGIYTRYTMLQDVIDLSVEDFFVRYR